MYGDAPDTVSVSTRTCAFDTRKPPRDPAGRFDLTKGKRYVNVVSLIIVETLVEIL